jgi:hypothetical protein
MIQAPQGEAPAAGVFWHLIDEAAAVFSRLAKD